LVYFRHSLPFQGVWVLSWIALDGQLHMFATFSLALIWAMSAIEYTWLWELVVFGRFLIEDWVRRYEYPIVGRCQAVFPHRPRFLLACPWYYPQNSLWPFLGFPQICYHHWEPSHTSRSCISLSTLQNITSLSRCWWGRRGHPSCRWIHACCWSFQLWGSCSKHQAQLLYSSDLSHQRISSSNWELHTSAQPIVAQDCFGRPSWRYYTQFS